jgi:hypothetical protein
MERMTRWFLMVVVAAVVGAVVGCGSMTTAPTPANMTTNVTTTASAGSGTAPQAASTTVADSPSGDGSASTLTGTTNESSSLLSGIPILGAITGLITRTLQLIGFIGGSLTNGRWTVQVPPNAVSGNGTVSIGVASLTSDNCQLGILPLSLNHFSTPVTLTVDCRSVPAQDLAGYTIFWYDPSTGHWVPVAGSQVDLVHKTVHAPLSHFSRYAVGPADGKAGW